MTWLAIAAAIVFAFDAWRLRQRLSGLAVLEPSDQPVSNDHVFLAAPGVQLGDPTRRAASHHARVHRLDVVELVPGDLPVLSLMSLLQLVDPAAYHGQRLEPGCAARHAMLASRDVLARAGVDPAATLDPIRYTRLAGVLKKYASATTDLALAPGLRSVPEDPRYRRALLTEQLHRAAPFVLAATPLLLVVLAAGVIYALPAGALALLAFHLQPWLIVAGSSARPSGLTAILLFRSPYELWTWLRTVTHRKLEHEPDPAEALRPVYRDLLARGLEQFFEPRRDRCPFCDGRDLLRYREVPDLVQNKPGLFTLTRCRGCGHIFQNPRLSIAGLEFYYRDFYDGLGESDLDLLFRIEVDSYKARAEMVKDVLTPRRWLDVGTGHGHFCCVARDVLPDTQFDGLDISDSVEEAARRGWIERPFRGLFPAVASSLNNSYQAVSMSHYLEHTRDPRAELAAAFEVLAEGGCLLIEVPDPESWFSPVLGRYWLPLFQPQHQHLLSAGNLDRLLRDAGFTPVTWNRGAHIPIDFSASMFQLFNHAGPQPGLPWRPPATTAQRVRTTAVWIVGAPLFLAAFAVDRLIAPLMRQAGRSNAYRVVARKAAPYGVGEGALR